MSVSDFFEQYSDAQEVHEVDGLLFLASAKADAEAYARNRQQEVVTYTREDYKAKTEKEASKRDKAATKKAAEVDADKFKSVPIVTEPVTAAVGDVTKS
jgi:hypothetical protein